MSTHDPQNPFVVLLLLLLVFQPLYRLPAGCIGLGLYFLVEEEVAGLHLFEH
jgi:hypothetical protein